MFGDYPSSGFNEIVGCASEFEEEEGSLAEGEAGSAVLREVRSVCLVARVQVYFPVVIL